MGRKDSDAWPLILGGLIGASLASPSKKDRDDLQYYRATEKTIEERKKKLGEIPSLETLKHNIIIYNNFLESTRLFLRGFFRESAFLSTAIIEYALKKKLGKKRFCDLIKQARRENIISKSDEKYLDGMRLERNDFVHDITIQVSENDSISIFHISCKIINKLL